MTQGDVSLVESLKKKLSDSGLADAVEWRPNISRDEKQDFLSELSIFTVPVQYEEAFGLYVIEAMAASVPVVQPNRSAFPELIESSGGGVCVDMDSPEKLAAAWHDLLEEPDRLVQLGDRGRLGVEEKYSMEAMKNSFITIVESLVQSKAEK